MSKRNIILIAIILVIIAFFAFGFMYLYKPANNTGGDTGSTNFLSNFFPFGKSTNVKDNNNGTSPVDVSGYIPTTTPSTQTPAKELLVKISSMPVAGYGVFMKERFKDVVIQTPAPEATTTTTIDTNKTNTPPTVADTKKGVLSQKIIPMAPSTEFVPSIRYVERATGNIYQTFADNIDERKFTTTMIPMVHDAFFGKNDDSVVMRYLTTDTNLIDSFIGILPKEILGGDTSISNEVTGSFLPENITDISVSPDGSYIFYLLKNNDSIIGSTATSYGDTKNQIFTSPFTEWLSQWPNDRMITLTTKPSAVFLGSVYSLDPNTKNFTKIFGGISGMTTLTSPNGKLILYNNNNLSLRIYNVDTKDSVSVGVKTMPEKCVWNKASTELYCAVPGYITGNNYPDTWYMGETSFSDNIWKINIENGSTTQIADPTSFSSGEEIDGIKLSLDDSEKYLFFVNKKDSYLWEFNLK